MKILIKKNESSDSIIRRLKYSMNKLGILKSIKNKIFYIKPKEKKKLKMNNKIIKIQKYIRENTFRRLF